MAATVEISEFNGSGETETTDITNSNMGSTDAANLTPASYPIVPGDRSYAKYQKVKVTDMGGSSSISNLKVWRTGALGGSATHVTNAGESGNYTQKSYSQPVSTSIADVDNAMPTTEPATANLGIGGSLSGTLTTTGASDYLVHQLVTDESDTEGSSSTLHFQYDEIS